MDWTVVLHIKTKGKDMKVKNKVMALNFDVDHN